jgi:hypothetical protein
VFLLLTAITARLSASIQSPRIVFSFLSLVSFASQNLSALDVRPFLHSVLNHFLTNQLVDLLATTAFSPNAQTGQPVTDLELLSRSLKGVQDMLDRVLAYVRAVLAGEREGDAAVGRYLMDTLGAAPPLEDGERGGFNASLQVRALANQCASGA